MSSSNHFSGENATSSQSLSLLEELLELRWGEQRGAWGTAHFLNYLDGAPHLTKSVLEAHRQELPQHAEEHEQLMVLLSQSGPSQICDATIKRLVQQRLKEQQTKDESHSELEMVRVAAICRYFSMHLGLDSHLLYAVGILSHLQESQACSQRFPTIITLVLEFVNAPHKSDREGVEIGTLVRIVLLAQALNQALKTVSPSEQVKTIHSSEPASFLGLAADDIKILLAALLRYSQEPELLGEAFCSFIQERSDLPNTLLKRSLALLAEQSQTQSSCVSSFSPQLLSTPQTSHGLISEFKANNGVKLELDPLMTSKQLRKTQKKAANINGKLPNAIDDPALSIRLPPLKNAHSDEPSESQQPPSSPTTLRQNSEAAQKSTGSSSAELFSLSFRQDAHIFELPYQNKNEKCAICSKSDQCSACPVCGSSCCPEHSEPNKYWCTLCERDYQRLKSALKPPLELLIVATFLGLISLALGYYLAQEKGLVASLGLSFVIGLITYLSLQGLTKMQVRTQRSRLYYKRNEGFRTTNSDKRVHSSLSPAVRRLAVPPQIKADLQAEAHREAQSQPSLNAAHSLDEQSPNTIASADDFKKPKTSEAATGHQFPGPGAYCAQVSAPLSGQSHSIDFGTSPSPSPSFIKLGSTSKRGA